MAITVKREEFLNAIKSTKTAIEKSNIQPILQAIHLKAENGGLTLTGTDLINTARTIIEANYTANDKFDVCINADRLESLVSKLDDFYVNIDILDNASVLFTSGKTKYKCFFQDVSEFPQINILLEEETQENKITLSKETFISGVNKTTFATQLDNNSRSVISGVCFTLNENKLEMAATDGNRLCVVDFEKGISTKKEGKYVLPRQALINFAKHIKSDVEICFKKDEIIFVSNNFIYTTKLINGNFPPYAQLFPQSFEKTIAIDKNSLLKALDKVSVMVNERTNSVRFIFSKNNLKILSECLEGNADDNIEIDYDCEDDKEFIIAFNYRFIIEGVKAMNSDVIVFNANSPLSATLFLGDFNYLAMPVQIS